jgi:hypothetical protein
MGDLGGPPLLLVCAFSGGRVIFTIPPDQARRSRRTLKY